MYISTNIYCIALFICNYLLSTKNNVWPIRFATQQQQVYVYSIYIYMYQKKKFLQGINICKKGDDGGSNSLKVPLPFRDMDSLN